MRSLLVVSVVLLAIGCGGSSSSNGCVQQSSEGSTPGAGMLYTACASSCSCAAGETSAQTAACAAPCMPYAEPGDQVTSPIATCLSFDKKTFYCSKICTSDTDCTVTGGSCAFGPLHEVGGIVVDTTKYCVKN